jgi:hypothetical protein
MRTDVFAALLLASLTLSWAQSERERRVSEPATYLGMCGASAAAAVGTNLFVVADDETSRLRIYRRDQGGPALDTVDLSGVLELERGASETDIEGAARLGEVVYWITSHSRNRRGREHPNRCRFFGTGLQAQNNRLAVSLVGRPYKDLLQDLIAAPALRAFNLEAASRLPPKARGGLNIEGLCATPDNQLLIGFRNPVPNGAALLVPLTNPAEVLAGQRARFGPPLQLDLEGRGIRDMAYCDGEYLLVAGAVDGGGKSRLYRWAGGGAKPKHLKGVDLKGLNPEAIVVYPDHGSQEVQLLSDDSSHRQGGIPCEDLRPAQRRFRAVWVTLGLARREPSGSLTPD